MISLLLLLFLLPRARRLGTVSFTEVAGVGWQASIRPYHRETPTKTLRRINAWTGQAKSLGSALRGALSEAKTHKTSGAGNGANFLPKLGGREFDPD
jgi:hypothetical protein